MRRADLLTGFASTGVLACLISPISWVHYLVWLVPALLLLADRALASGPGVRRRLLLAGAVLAYLVLASSLVFLWCWDFGGVDGFAGGSAFVWVALGLLLGLPLEAGSVRSADAHWCPDVARRPVAGDGRTSSAA